MKILGRVEWGGGGGFTKISYGICFSFFVHEKKRGGGFLLLLPSLFSFYDAGLLLLCIRACVRSFTTSANETTATRHSVAARLFNGRNGNGLARLACVFSLQP